MPERQRGGTLIAVVVLPSRDGAGDEPVFERAGPRARRRGGAQGPVGLEGGARKPPGARRYQSGALRLGDAAQDRQPVGAAAAPRGADSGRSPGRQSARRRRARGRPRCPRTGSGCVFGHQGEVGLVGSASTRVASSRRRRRRHSATRPSAGSSRLARRPPACSSCAVRSAAMRCQCRGTSGCGSRDSRNGNEIGEVRADRRSSPWLVMRTRLLRAIGSATTSFSSERGTADGTELLPLPPGPTSIVVIRPAAVVMSLVGSLEAVIWPRVASVALSRGTGVTSSVGAAPRRSSRRCPRTGRRRAW